MKVFFQSLAVMFGVNIGLSSRLAQYKDLKVIVGTPEPLLYLYGTFYSRYYGVKFTIIPPPFININQSTRKMGLSIAKMMTCFYRNFVRAGKFDIVHLNSPEQPFAKVSLDIKKPKILTLHRLPYKDESDIFAKVDATIACSEFISRAVQEKFGYKPKVIHHGVETNLFHTNIPSTVARKKLGFPVSGKIVLWNGRLTHTKDLKTLINAIPMVAKEMPDALFIIKGRSKRAIPNDILQHAKKHLKITGTERNVVFRLGYEFISKMPYYYRSADVLAHTSLFESFGLVLAEAMACGVPIVAANTATAPELVGNAGLLFEPKNSNDLSDKILRLLSDEELRTRLGKRGLHRIRRLGLTWKKAARSYRDIYLSLA